MLEEIKRKVNLRLSQSHKEIIVGVYRNAVRFHNSFCGCNYCKVLEEYVHKKKAMHAMHSMVNDYDYPYYDTRATAGDYRIISRLGKVIGDLKEEKDKLKEF